MLKRECEHGIWGIITGSFLYFHSLLRLLYRFTKKNYSFFSAITSYFPIHMHPQSNKPAQALLG